MTVILSAEAIGEAVRGEDGTLNIGGVTVPWEYPTETVYVRRSSRDLSITEICLARHDGLAAEAGDEQNRFVSRAGQAAS